MRSGSGTHCKHEGRNAIIGGIATSLEYLLDAMLIHQQLHLCV